MPPRNSNYYSGEGTGTGAGESLKALRRILQEHLEIEVEEEESEEGEERHSLSPHSLLDTRSLGMFFKREECLQGEVVFDVGQRADKVYFIEEGCVEIVLAAEGPWGRNAAQPERVNKISVGGIFGEAAFFLDLPHRSAHHIIAQHSIVYFRIALHPSDYPDLIVLYCLAMFSVFHTQ